MTQVVPIGSESVRCLIDQLGVFLSTPGRTLQSFSSAFETWVYDESVDHHSPLVSGARYRTERYSRQILYRHEDLFEIVMIGWLPDQKTSIHGHPSGGCLFMVLEGVLQEVRYPGGGRLHHPGEPVQYIDDTMGQHEVRCVSRSPTVSLHIYSPPFSVSL